MKDEDELREAIKRHPAGSGRKKLELSAITIYQCCDHCVTNFTENDTWDTASNCAKHPNSHTAPCNEPGCVLGTTPFNF